MSRLAAFSEAVSPFLLGAKCLGKANALSDTHLTHGWATSSLLILLPSHRTGLGMTILSSCRQRDRKGILLLENTFFPSSLYRDTMGNPSSLLFWDVIRWNGTSRVAQMVKHLPTMQETWVRSLGWEDPLEKEIATHSSTLAWKIPWTEGPGRLQSMGSLRVGHD